jgi:hypothetical protein
LLKFSSLKERHDYYKEMSQEQLSAEKMKILNERVSALRLKYSHLLKDETNNLK